MQKALVVLAQVVRSRARSLAEHARDPEAVIHRAALDKLIRCLDADGFGYDKRIIRPVSAELRLAFLLGDHKTNFSEAGLERLVQRLETVATDDPALAVSATRDVCESFCQFILAERTGDEELPRTFAELLDRTLERLQLLPEQARVAGRRATPARRCLRSASFAMV